MVERTNAGKINHDVIRRLAFVKYLYDSAIQQSYKPMPLKCGSILTMHDAVELFLRLTSEYRDIKTKSGNSFMQLLEEIESKLDDVRFQRKESMRRMSQARAKLKHNGNFPSEMDISSYREMIKMFFEENTPIVFDIEFSNISLIDFVNPDTSREKLKGAQNCLSDGKILDALDYIAVSFEYMVHEYIERKGLSYLCSPFSFGTDVLSFNSRSMRIDMDELHSPLRVLGNFVDAAGESINEIQGALKIIALGIDFRRYTRFKHLTPKLSLFSGNYNISRKEWKSSNYPSREDVEFCFNFVIETALHLSGFDYTISDPIFG